MSPRLRLGRSKWARAAALAAAVSLAIVVPTSSASAGASHEQIQGAGSSWAFNAINQWISDVTQQHGWQVVFTPSGSATGRQDYANGINDYAVSDIGYQGTNPITGGSDSSNRAYAYLPMVAGGTAFPYNIVVGTHRVTNLRLSGLSLAKIFTNQITNWDDPAITADNNGHALPSIPIIPVVHSEGAGTTYQFTNYLFSEYPSLWESFTKQATGQTYSFPVEYWPTGAGSQVSENGSDGVMSFVTSSAGQGSIGYDEYSYALGANFPVVPIENSAGYFNFPDAYNVAVSLTQAQINYDQNPAHCAALGYPTMPCYLLEKLNHVYTYNDPRTYPLSSYSYMIEPTGASDPTMNTAKRQTLADFISYSICQGQAEMAPIGYSPMPINLVQASYQQVALLRAADPGVDLSSENVANCHNPTFIPGQPTNNYLAKIAPQPPACAKAGAGPCPGQYAFNGNPVGGHAGGYGVTTSHGSSSGSSSSATTTPGAGSSSSASSSGSSGSTASGANSTASGPSSSVKTASKGAAKGGAKASSQAVGVAATTTTTSAPPVAVATNLATAHLPGGFWSVALEVVVAILLLLLLASPALWIRIKGRTGRSS